MNETSPSTTPLISVITPHLNQPDGLATCLKSLDAQTLDRSQFEIIVVDNGSASRPDEIVARHSNARLLEELEPGPGPARNRGVQAARGRILAFIDADCIAHPDWLLTVQREATTLGEKAILGGAVLIARRDPTRYTNVEAFESVFSYDQKACIEKFNFSGGGNMAVWRTAFDKIGSFGGIAIAEDLEWGQRAGAAGIRTRYIPGMIVYHPARPSLSALHAQWDRYTQQAFNGVQKTPFWQIRWIFRTCIALASPVLLLPKLIRTDRVHGVEARFQAWLVLVAIRWRRTVMMLSLMHSNRGVVWNRNTEVKTP
jgi:glycosyltransferase involved in cell wall biosynthesis